MGLIERDQYDRINRYIYERDIQIERAKASAPFTFLFMLIVGWGFAYLLKEIHLYDWSGYLFFGTPCFVGILMFFHKLSVGNKKSLF